MFRLALAAALLAALPLMPRPASAQQAPFVTVECSQNITGVGRRAAVFQRAVTSAIDAYDAEARRIHGARTAFTFLGGEGLYRGGRLSLNCTRRAGLHACEARGRTCAWVETTTRNTEVASQCQRGFVHSTVSNLANVRCVWSRRLPDDGIPVPPHMPDCPFGYTLDSANTTRCLRG